MLPDLGWAPIVVPVVMFVMVFVSPIILEVIQWIRVNVFRCSISSETNPENSLSASGQADSTRSKNSSAGTSKV